MMTREPRLDERWERIVIQGENRNACIWCQKPKHLWRYSRCETAIILTVSTWAQGRDFPRGITLSDIMDMDLVPRGRVHEYDVSPWCRKRCQKKFLALAARRKERDEKEKRCLKSARKEYRRVRKWLRENAPGA